MQIQSTPCRLGAAAPVSDSGLLLFLFQNVELLAVDQLHVVDFAGVAGLCVAPSRSFLLQLLGHLLQLLTGVLQLLGQLLAVPHQLQVELLQLLLLFLQLLNIPAVILGLRSRRAQQVLQGLLGAPGRLLQLGNLFGLVVVLGVLWIGLDVQVREHSQCAQALTLICSCPAYFGRSSDPPTFPITTYYKPSVTLKKHQFTLFTFLPRWEAITLSAGGAPFSAGDFPSAAVFVSVLAVLTYKCLNSSTLVDSSVFLLSGKFQSWNTLTGSVLLVIGFELSSTRSTIIKLAFCLAGLTLALGRESLSGGDKLSPIIILYKRRCQKITGSHSILSRLLRISRSSSFLRRFSSACSMMPGQLPLRNFIKSGDRMISMSSQYMRYSSRNCFLSRSVPMASEIWMMLSGLGFWKQGICGRLPSKAPRIKPAMTKITEVYSAVKPSPPIRFWYLSHSTQRKTPLPVGSRGSGLEELVEISAQYTLLVSWVELTPLQNSVRYTPSRQGSTPLGLVQTMGLGLQEDPIVQSRMRLMQNSDRQVGVSQTVKVVYRLSSWVRLRLFEKGYMKLVSVERVSVTRRSRAQSTTMEKLLVGCNPCFSQLMVFYRDSSSISKLGLEMPQLTSLQGSNYTSWNWLGISEEVRKLRAGITPKPCSQNSCAVQVKGGLEKCCVLQRLKQFPFSI